MARPSRKPDRPAGSASTGDGGEARRAGTPLREAMLQATPVGTAYRLNYVANAFTAVLYERMERDEGVTRGEFVVLLCLSLRGTATAQEIAEATRRPKNSLSRAVRELERKGLVERRTDPGDQRRQPIRTTEAGRAVFARLLPMAETREAEMLAGLDAHERRTLSALLLKIGLEF